MIHNAADCCRNNGAKIEYSVTSTSTNLWGQQVTDHTVDFGCHVECEAICNSKSDCKYFSHSTRWDNCVLCSECDFTESGNSRYYTSWEKGVGT